MPAFTRCTGLAVMAGLMLLTGCAASQPSPGAAKSPSPANSSTAPQAPPTTAPPTTAPSSPAGGQPDGTSRACAQAGSYLTSVSTGQHSGYDRVVFQFSGGLPAVTASRVAAVYADPKGTQVPLAGQSYLRLVFRGASGVCPPSAQRTWTGPSVLTPYYPQLLTVSAAGDFEGYLSFGIGLAAKGSYHVSTLTGPDRVVIDVSHVALGKFPGIWDITSWSQYWTTQYAWLNGHQPWRSSPPMVVQAWADSHGYTNAAIHQVTAGTFTVTQPGRQTATVTGTRPVSVPGPWVITRISYGTAA
jgi:hypothetical protein